MSETCTDVKTCKDPLFVGIDPSVNSTGLIVLDQNANIIESKLFSVASEKFEESLLKYEKEIKFIPNIITLQSVYLEGAAYQSTGQAILQMGALHFLTRLFLFKKKVNYKILSGIQNDDIHF